MVLSAEMVTPRKLPRTSPLKSLAWPKDLKIPTDNTCSRVSHVMVLFVETVTNRAQLLTSQEASFSVGTNRTHTTCNKASLAMVLSAEMATNRPPTRRKRQVLVLPDINKIPTQLSCSKPTKPCTAKTSEIKG